MGWASGARLADNLYGILIKLIPDDRKVEIAEKIIEAFDQMDCDVETMWDKLVWEYDQEKDCMIHVETKETYQEYQIRKRNERNEQRGYRL